MEVMESLENTIIFNFFISFPTRFGHSMYSTNLIESLNKRIKHQRKRRSFS
ncbi:hypothetical protein GOM46_06800 [Streptococcus infantis]|uniref:transposase n=1 Tax=Streptococcus infantis TaxID=68892 RepID=UPI0039E18AD0|nr:hypothetical protein GOM46_06800 [Streptococcus infantis]